MKNIKRVGLYNPYLDVLGGGEKYILSILKVFDEKNYQIDIFFDENLKEKIGQRFEFNFKNLNFLPNIFWRKANFFEKYCYLKKYDLFFYVTDGSYFFPFSKKNYIYAMVPDKKLYSFNLLNRIKILPWRFFTHSFFCQKNLQKWGTSSFVLYPYIDEIFYTSRILKKEKIILSVARFFPHLHSKQHKNIIEAFKKIKKSHNFFKDFKLILAGAIKKEDSHYLNQLKKIAQNDPSIVFKTNVSFSMLLELYHKSMFFWHFTGFGVDENKNPQNVEHLGIAPLEAMASGCLVYCYNSGGPKELITDGKNGFLFSRIDELERKMLLMVKGNKNQNRIIENGQNFIKKKFSYQFFKKNVLEQFI
ncbi:MAG: glycosyltransferase [Microgenomates group bacterium]